MLWVSMKTMSSRTCRTAVTIVEVQRCVESREKCLGLGDIRAWDFYAECEVMAERDLGIR